MAEAEGSFKVCGLCSQLVDEAVKLADDLLEFLVEFLTVNGSKLPTKICTECYTGAIESRKFKEKCLRTVNKLHKTQISSSMILGRSSGDIKTMRHKYRTVKPVAAVAPAPAPVTPLTIVSGKRVSKPSSKLTSNSFITPPRAASRRVSENSATGSDDVPLSTRHSLRKKAIKNSAGVEIRKIPTVMLSPKDRSAADEVLEKTTGLNTSLKRSLKRKIQSPARFDNSHVYQKKPKTVETPKAVKPAPPTKPAKKEPEVIEIEDEEEIFPSVGPYQCEICQEITDTKQLFVEHVKSLHKDMVDEQVLRSLETDLKKRMKKEQTGGANKDASKKTSSTKSKSGSDKSKSSGDKSKQLVDGLKLDKPKTNKPRPRPRPKYTETDDDEYNPSGKKKRKSAPTTPGKTADLFPPGPGECDICGTKLSQASQIPRHKETLKCRQAAFNKSQQMLRKQSVDAESEKVEGEEAKGINTTEETATSATSQPQEQSSIELLNQSEGNSNDSEGTGQKLNGLDAKFKASIAKRYEAERESGEGEEKTDAVNVEPSPLVHDLEDTDLAIKQAMQESIETAEKEKLLVGKGVSLSEQNLTQPNFSDLQFDHNDRQSEENKPNGQYDSEHMHPQTLRENSNNLHAQQLDERLTASRAQQQQLMSGDDRGGVDPGQHQQEVNRGLHQREMERRQQQREVDRGQQEHGEEDDEGEQSPAAYIDPNPQPDVEPHKQHSVIQSVIQKNGHRQKQDLPVTSNFVKPWETPEGSRETSTLDLSALGASSHHLHHQDPSVGAMPSLDSLESQMAALHGPGGANTPWHTSQFDYYQQ